MAAKRRHNTDTGWSIIRERKGKIISSSEELTVFL